MSGDIWTVIGGIAVTVFIAGWAWFKAHAAQSAAAWDDEAVAFVQNIAQGVVDANKPAAPAPAPAPAPAAPAA